MCLQADLINRPLQHYFSKAVQYRSDAYTTLSRKSVTVNQEQTERHCLCVWTHANTTVIHSTTLNVPSAKQWHLSLQHSTFVKTFIGAFGELRRVTNNFRTEPIRLKNSTAGARSGIKECNTHNSEKILVTGYDVRCQLLLHSSTKHDSNWECQDDSTNEMTCSYIYRSIQELRTIKGDLDEIRKRLRYLNIIETLTQLRKIMASQCINRELHVLSYSLISDLWGGSMWFVVCLILQLKAING